MIQGKTSPQPGRPSRIPLSSAHAARRLRQLGGQQPPALPNADLEAPDLL